MSPEPRSPRAADSGDISGSSGSTLGRMLRGILWVLVIAFLVGFLIGSLLRRELERPVRYIGGHDGTTTLWDGPPSRSDSGHAQSPSDDSQRPSLRGTSLDFQRSDLVALLDSMSAAGPSEGTASGRWPSEI